MNTHNVIRAFIWGGQILPFFFLFWGGETKESGTCVFSSVNLTSFAEFREMFSKFSISQKSIFISQDSSRFCSKFRVSFSLILWYKKFVEFFQKHSKLTRLYSREKKFPIFWWTEKCPKKIKITNWGGWRTNQGSFVKTKIWTKQ